MLVNGVPMVSDEWVEDARFASNRERACVWENLLALRLEQECKSNILIEELGTDGYTMLALELLDGYVSYPEERIRLREDTLEALAELVQHGIVLQLQRSLKLELAFVEGSGYPTATLTSIEQQAELAGMLERLPSSRGRFNQAMINRELLIGTGTRTEDRVVRRFLYRAGIPKFASFTFVWEMILHLTEKILLPACLSHNFYYLCSFYCPYNSFEDMIDEERGNGFPKTKVQSWQMTQYVPPNLYLQYDDDGNELYLLAPVPGKLEESSKRLGLARMIYSVLGDPSSIAAVQENYEVAEDIVVINYEDDGNISGFVDHCGDDDKESDFSVYSDAEKDMMSTGDDLNEALEAFPRLFRN